MYIYYGTGGLTFVAFFSLQCTSREIEIMDPSIRAIVGGVRYYSETIRSIKVAELEDTAENYGDAVIYNGR